MRRLYKFVDRWQGNLAMLPWVMFAAAIIALWTSKKIVVRFDFKELE